MTSTSMTACRARRWLLAAAVLGTACNGVREQQAGWASRPPHPTLIGPPRAKASAAFRATWFDGTAELSGYRVTVPRYGELRTGELVLTYVTEPMNRTTRIKDDDAPSDARVDVLKLNANLTFLAGVYPYSVMTSVFSPIDDWGEDVAPRFAPVKITLTAQEWCGHVFHAVWPGREAFATEIASYFASEGEETRRVSTPRGTLYEDALLIQLRELDAPFAGGGDWSGSLVPSLWRLRRAHVAPAPVPATVTRQLAERDGTPVTRFVLNSEGYRRTFDVERSPARRILGWTTSDGEEARLLETARLAYWKLNHVGEENYRERLGLPVDLRAPPAAPPEGTVQIGR